MWINEYSLRSRLLADGSTPWYCQAVKKQTLRSLCLEATTSLLLFLNCGLRPSRILLPFSLSSPFVRPSQLWYHIFSPVHDDLDHTNHTFSYLCHLCRPFPPCHPRQRCHTRRPIFDFKNRIVFQSSLVIVFLLKVWTPCDRRGEIGTAFQLDHHVWHQKCCHYKVGHFIPTFQTKIYVIFNVFGNQIWFPHTGTLQTFASPLRLEKPWDFGCRF